MTDLPNVQLFLRPNIIEFGWGHPNPALLPANDLRGAAEIALREDGATTLAYGAEQGPGRLIELLCEHLGRIDGVTPTPEQVVVTGGISQAIDLLCTLTTQPGDVALVESPVYHLALRILRDHALELMPVAADRDGLRPDALEDALTQVRRAGKRARLLYTVPTFTNPTGRSLVAERRPTIIRLAAESDVLVIEDDVYRELWYDTPPPPPLTSYGDLKYVARLGSFSKILSPGLRLGWMVADPALVQRWVLCGMIDSGGGVNHFTACIVAAYMDQGLLEGHVADLRATYRARRDILVEALRRSLPPGCQVESPDGGFFVWVRLPEGIDSTLLLPLAEEAGVSYIPGTRFHSDGGGQQHLRLTLSLLSPEEMAEGARRLGEIIKRSSTW